MKRSTFEGATVVYSYGSSPRTDFDEFGKRQLRLAHTMRNELVAIELHHDKLRDAAEKGACPPLAMVCENIRAAKERIDALETQKQEEHVQDRRLDTRYATAAQLVNAKKELRILTEKRKEIRRQEQPTLQEARKAPDEERTSLYDAVGKAYVQKGLCWGTCNFVLYSMKNSRTKIIQDRTEGSPSNFRMHRWTGEGTLNAQNQKQKGKPRQIQWQIMGNHPKHKVLQLRLGRNVKYGGPHSMELPFVYHRELPCSPQDITDTRITRTILAGKPRISIQFVCRVAAPKPRTAGAAISVKIGWKNIPNKGMRIADINSSLPLTNVPIDLRPLIRFDTETFCQFILPPHYTYPMLRTSKIEHIRDKRLNLLRSHVIAALDDPIIQNIVHGNPAKWETAERFVNLYRSTPKDHPLYTILETWYRRDWHLWQYEANERDQTIARRNDLYRKFAAWIAGQALEMELVVLPDTDYAELKKKATTKDDSYQAQGSRRLLQFAAPGTLRLYMTQAARKNGVQIMWDAGEKKEEDMQNASD